MKGEEEERKWLSEREGHGIGRLYKRNGGCEGFTKSKSLEGQCQSEGGDLVRLFFLF